MRHRPSYPQHSIDISEEGGVRSLHFGSDWVQGAMRIARPWALELDYTREMMAGLLFRAAQSWPKTALLIGLGAGSLAKFIYRHFPDCKITIVEINPQVEFVARQYFKLPDDRRIRVIIGDGADYMLSGSDSFDYILLDGFDAEACCGPLDTLPFYQACRARLNSHGLLTANLLGKSKGFAASVERIRSAFEQQAIVFPSCDSGNTIAFAATAPSRQYTLEELRQNAEKLKEETGLNLLPTISRIQLCNAFPDSQFHL